ncbi:M48 family metalloprotease [Catenibacterium faecis]|uniref:M48 family metalloprotease n=1 Tax=Catenibacterium faecis TaxID=2764323 RepID=A0ABR7KDV9_9FIRM|nr:M48 family metalloprotease [Catenibacterium faecis]MBC6010889.1 M48 family metalloprotease [Catenibacterium faecis]
MKTNLILTILLLLGDWYILNQIFNAPILLCILLILILIFIGNIEEHITVRINQAIRLDQMPVNSYSMFYRQVIEDIDFPYSGIHCYYLDDDVIGVTHYGLHTIVVTKGMLKLFDEDALRACISHECGHIYNCDMVFSQVVSLNILALIFFILLFYSGMMAFLFIMMIILVILGSFSFTTYFAGSLFVKFLKWFMKSMQSLLMGLNNLILKFYMTRRDYEADQYAVLMDEDNRSGLIHYLNRYEANSNKRVKKLEDNRG